MTTEHDHEDIPELQPAWLPPGFKFTPARPTVALATALYRALHDLRDLAAWDHLPEAEQARINALLEAVDGLRRR